MTERTYTLAEAQAELNRRSCNFHGHSWSVTEDLTIGPIAVVCDTCGRAAKIATDLTLGNAKRAGAREALLAARKAAHERGDVGREGCIEVWDWLDTLIAQEES